MQKMIKRLMSYTFAILISISFLTPSIIQGWSLGYPAKQGILKAQKKIACYLIWGRKRLVDLETKVDAQKTALHALWDKHFPSRDQVVIEVKRKWAQHELDFSYLPNGRTADFPHDIKSLVDAEINDLQLMQIAIAKTHMIWPMIEYLTDCTKQAQRIANINTDTGFRFEALFPVHYAALDTAFNAAAYSALGWLPVWWNLSAEMSFMWRLQKKIYRLEAIKRIIWEDQTARDQQHQQGVQTINHNLAIRTG